MARSSTSFKPGQIGNPKGRPKKGNTIADMMNVYLNGKELNPKTGQRMTRKEILVRAMVASAMKGNSSSMRLIWERMDGMLTPEMKGDGELSRVEAVLNALNQVMKQ